MQTGPNYRRVLEWLEAVKRRYLKMNVGKTNVMVHAREGKEDIGIGQKEYKAGTTKGI